MTTEPRSKAFTKSVPRESTAERWQRSEAGANRIKQSLWAIQAYSICAGLGAAGCATFFRSMPLLFIPFVVVGAIVGAVLGSIATILFVLVSYLRHGGWLSEERINVIPTIWFYGPLGAIGGSCLGVLVGAASAERTLGQAAEKGTSTDIAAVVLGGIGGAVLCAIARFAMRRRHAAQPQPLDHVFWP